MTVLSLDELRKQVEVVDFGISALGDPAAKLQTVAQDAMHTTKDAIVSSQAILAIMEQAVDGISDTLGYIKDLRDTQGLGSDGSVNRINRLTLQLSNSMLAAGIAHPDRQMVEDELPMLPSSN